MRAPLHVLVDYDNAKTGRERTRSDAEYNLDIILDRVSARLGYEFRGADEAIVRLYGGWVERSNRRTDLATWLELSIPAARGRRNGIRLRPTLSFALLACPEQGLIGTFRAEQRLRNSERGAQKMVDQMLACDAIFLCADPESGPVAIVSDDDDFVPAAIYCSRLRKRPGIAVLRQNKPAGSQVNDVVLEQLGIRCLEY